MPVNTTIVEVAPPMLTREPTSKRWNAVYTTVSDVEDHGHITLRHWDGLVDLIGDPGREYAIDGESLNLATVVAVARYVLQKEEFETSPAGKLWFWIASKLIEYTQIRHACNRQQQNLHQGKGERRLP